VDAEAKPKRKAKDNPWYRLATRHGEPSKSDDEIAIKNRETWNRWMASLLSDELRTDLIKSGRWTCKELTPFPEAELRSIEAQVGLYAATALDFSNTEFDVFFCAGAFIFPSAVSFVGATFRGAAYFGYAMFRAKADFGSATFSGDAYLGHAIFSDATFSAESPSEDFMRDCKAF